MNKLKKAFELLLSNMFIMLLLVCAIQVLANETVNAYNYSSPIPLEWEFGRYIRFADDHGYACFATSDLHIQPFYEYSKKYDMDFYYPIKGTVEFSFYGMKYHVPGVEPDPDWYLTSCSISFSGQYIKLLNRSNLTDYTHILEIDETKWIRKPNNTHSSYTFDTFPPSFWVRNVANRDFRFNEELTEILFPYMGGYIPRVHYATYYKAKYNTTPDQDEEYDSGFTVGPKHKNPWKEQNGSSVFGHNNNFRNNEKDFFLSEESSKTYKISGISGLYQKLLDYAASDGERNNIRTKTDKEWKGACYGISATMALVFLNEMPISEISRKAVSYYYQLEKPNVFTYFRDVIHYYDNSQDLEAFGGDGLSKFITYDSLFEKTTIPLSGKVLDRKSFLSNLVKAAREATKNKRVLILSYGIKIKGERKGHAVLITGYKYTSQDKMYELKIYDMNKGCFTWMTIPGDFSIFTLDASAGPINEANFLRLRYIDPRDFKNIKINSNIINQENRTNYTFISFSSNSSFKLKSSEGHTLTYDKGEMGGNLPILSIDIINSDIKLKTDHASSFRIEPTSRNLNIKIYDDNDYKVVDGKGIESIDVSLSGDIKLIGKSFAFRTYSSVEERLEGEQGLGCIYAKGNGEVVIHKGQNTIEATSDNPMSNVETKIYQGVEVIEGKIKGKQNSVVIKPCEETIGSSTSIEDGMIIFSKQGYAYRGRPIKPFVSVYVGGKSLKKNKEFKVQYENNVEVGTGKLTVTGVGEYSGSLSAEFPIIPKKVKMKKVSSCKSGFEVTWNSSGPKDGFEIQYATDSDFKNAATMKIEDSGASSAQVEGLEIGEEYFVRIRAYKTETETGKAFNSNWSDVKSVLIYPY